MEVVILKSMNQSLFSSSIMKFKPTKSGIIFKFSLGDLREVGVRIELSEIIKEESTCEDNNELKALKDGKN